MKSYSKRTVSAVLAAALSASVLTALPFSAGAEDATTQREQGTILFMYEEEGVTIKPDEDGNVPELSDLTGYIGDSIKLPDVKLEKEGYRFSGWTADGFRGFTAGEVIQFLDVQTELKPVWVDKADETLYKASYAMDAEDVEYDPEMLPNFTKGAAGTFVTVSLQFYPREGYKQLGWVAEGREFRGEQHFIITDHDITITPNWKKIYDIIYDPGAEDRIIGGTVIIDDIIYDPGAEDRIIGGTDYVFPGTEESFFNLQASDRFSRQGFEFDGWLCSDDGKIYPQLAPFTMPSHDITFTAVWKPKTYNMLFDEGNTSFKLRATTDDVITMPENQSKKSGYTFSGWKYEGKVYQPGEQYTVEGTMPGLGYYFEAVWTSNAKFPELLGDANGDNEVNLADAVRIMQSVSNPDKYELCEQAEKNADVDGLSGVTYRDALYIQRYKLGLVTSLTAEVTAE